MVGETELLELIGTVYDAGLDAGLWPKALAGIARLVGGAAATIEVFGKQSLRPHEIYLYGLPPAAELKYVEQYFTLNRRLPVVARDRLGQLSWDYRIVDEEMIGRDPFYMEFLAPIELRYFVGGIIVTNTQEFAGVCVHRTPKQGHIGRAGLALMERLLPHVKGAFDVARRLRGAGQARAALERALDWLSDGVALVSADRRLIYANEPFRAIARAADGIEITKGFVEVASPEARARLSAALGDAAQLRRGESRSTSSDFALPRPSGAPSHLVSVRPVPEHGRERGLDASADAIIFLRNPASRAMAGVRTLREIFGLTEAEAALARALQAGITLGEYATSHSVSLNTIYTHLRHVKEKLGCRRLPDLIRKLNDLHVPLRDG